MASLFVPALFLAGGAVMAFDACLAAVSAGDFTIAARFLLISGVLAYFAGRAAVLYLEGWHVRTRP